MSKKVLVLAHNIILNKDGSVLNLILYKKGNYIGCTSQWNKNDEKIELKRVFGEIGSEGIGKQVIKNIEYWAHKISEQVGVVYGSENWLDMNGNKKTLQEILIGLKKENVKMDKKIIAKEIIKIVKQIIFN